jgi:hypothetical protein
MIMKKSRQLTTKHRLKKPLPEDPKTLLREVSF